MHFSKKDQAEEDMFTGKRSLSFYVKIFRTHRTDDGQGENRGRGQQQRNNGSFKYLPLLQFLPLLIIIISSFALNFQTEVSFELFYV